jgi:hypothetical protein
MSASPFGAPSIAGISRGSVSVCEWQLCPRASHTAYTITIQFFQRFIDHNFGHHGYGSRQQPEAHIQCRQSCSHIDLQMPSTETLQPHVSVTSHL